MSPLTAIFDVFLCTSSIEHGGTSEIFIFMATLALECIFMAPLALFNEGVPAHFSRLMEAPTMRLPNVKTLLC